MIFANLNSLFQKYCVKFLINTLELYRIMSESQLPLMDEPEVAGFVVKTYQILNNDEFGRIVYWGANGREFVIKDITKFQEMVLPKYFRHKKINSFIRQLNMYGFHKSRRENTKSIFSHPYFIKGREDLLKSIKRKVKVNSSDPVTPVKNRNKDNQAQLGPQKHGSSFQLFGSQKRQQTHLDTAASKYNSLNNPIATIKESPSFKNQGDGYQINAREFLDSRQCLQQHMNLNFVNYTSLNKVSQNFLDGIIDNGEYYQNENCQNDEIVSIENAINQDIENRMNDFQGLDFTQKNKDKRCQKKNVPAKSAVKGNQNGNNSGLQLNIVFDGPSHFLLPTKDDENK